MRYTGQVILGTRTKAGTPIRFSSELAARKFEDALEQCGVWKFMPESKLARRLRSERRAFGFEAGPLLNTEERRIVLNLAGRMGFQVIAY